MDRFADFIAGQRYRTTPLREPALVRTAARLRTFGQMMRDRFRSAGP